jgi:serine protease Do
MPLLLKPSSMLVTCLGLFAFTFTATHVSAQRPAQTQAPPPAATQASPLDALDRMNQAVEALTRKVWPSVVQIVVTTYSPREQGRGDEADVVLGRGRSVGSGFVIDADGYVMTNAHVVANAQRVQVVLPPPNADGSLVAALSGKMNIVNARVVGFSSEVDLALLKVDGPKLAPLPLATYSQMKQGESVFAFGSPRGLRNTLTHGLVSAVARQISVDSPLIYIQTDAPINPGNSGGPLVNTKGEVVGINTFILSPGGGSDGLGFAIPSAMVRTAFRQFKDYGQLRRQEVGMSLQTITPAMAASLKLPRDFGVIVSDVWPGGPAEAAGLKVGDVLVSVDGQPAENLPSVIYSFRLRDSMEKVQLNVLRGTAEMILRMTAVEERSDLDSAVGLADPEKSIVRELGILGVEVDERIAKTAKGLRMPYGVIVAARVAGATSEVPLQVRDIVLMVNDRPIMSLQSLRDAMRALPLGSAVTLQLQRDGKLMYLSFMLD